ncbi:uncharacterized protein H6S33_010196 [Morchella sextelata]|uniref:uncharacterized protein n=1 Tax=Morchella sextelata TaxID=1174677 RepID=UPI001D04040B|nr:uncharacterized protein H6S33_010196 [Morchella sextelata]KAH0612144.1 hypothetical protein H6S33_010196 [Morchella sextelata]
MDINFVLNNSPSSNIPQRSADTAFSNSSIRGTSGYKNRPQDHMAQNIENSPVQSRSPTDEHHFTPAYRDYQSNSNNQSTISSRSSYSGPSLQSTAATSPLEIPMAAHHHHSNATSSAENSYTNDKINESTISPGSSFPGRLLPPLSNNNHPISANPNSSEVALSPRSTSHHYHHQTSDISYFSSSPSSSYVAFTQQQQQYQSSAYPPPPQNHGPYDTLLSFAEVAMGASTVHGRRSLEVEAAEALAGRRGSGSSLRHSDHNIRTSSNHMPVNSSRTFQVDIDPELRPASAGSVASTGRTIEDEGSMSNVRDSRSLQAQRSALVARSVHEHAYNRDTPLFLPIPEAATPRQEPVAPPMDAGPSTNSSTGPLHTVSSPHDFLVQSPKCSYCASCTTGSPLRKVVSHIFGRNKLSTRQIPKNVWVYYCRKHYQRSRYRNPRGFARQQVLLVKRQCERLELWGGVKDWVIKVRRREELRMNREGGENGEELEDEEEAEDHIAGDEDIELGDGGPTSGESSRRNSTATPRRRSSTGGNNWIMRHTGTEKTISDVYKLLERIEVEVQENGGKFPDVELLPNVELTMAIPIRGPDGDGDENGNGNAGGDDNQEGAEDEGIPDRTVGKKRRRSDGGSGSSGGDDTKGKARERPHLIWRLSQIKSPEALQHGVDGMANSERIKSVSAFSGRSEQQTITPPPSASASTGRSTPEIESEFIIESNTQKNFAERLSSLSPRRSTGDLPSTMFGNIGNASLYNPHSFTSSGVHLNHTPRRKSSMVDRATDSFVYE